MELNQFIQIGLPVSLALIMLSLGLTTDFRQFLHQVASPGATVVGLLAQLCLVPLLALLVVLLLDLPPALAAGLMILSFCPGGVTSNWFSHMARGNVPLSISLTVIASLITPFTIPLLSELVLQWQLSDDRAVSIPLGLTMVRLFAISVIPVAIGIALRTRFFNITERLQPRIYRFATTLFMGVIAAMIINQWEQLPGLLAQSGVASLSVIIAGMAAGSVLAKLARLSPRDRHTVTIEVGMQNGGMALVVTQAVLHSAELSIVPVIYGLIMLVPIYLYSRYARTQQL